MSDTLTASITASRNPVYTDNPELSTSTLTCNVEGILNKESNKYKQYLSTLWGRLDCSTYPYPTFVYADGTTWLDADNLEKYCNGAVTDNNDTVTVDGTLYIREYYSDSYPYIRATVDNPIEVCFKYKANSLSTGNITKNTVVLWGQAYYKGGSYNFCGYHLRKLDNGKWIISVDNRVDYSYTYEPITDELDIDFFDWVDVKIRIFKMGDYSGKNDYAELYINNKYIPFHRANNDENYTGNNAHWLQGTNIYASSSNNCSTIRNYWHYNFASYESWYYNESLSYKDYHINKLSLNPDYEEYPELTYKWSTNETTPSIEVEPKVDTTYSCTVNQADRSSTDSILIQAKKEIKKPIARISPQDKPYIEHFLGKFYATNSYDINEPASRIVKYIWNGVETDSPSFTTIVNKTTKITLQVVNESGLTSDIVEVDLSQSDTEQDGYQYTFKDIPLYLICYKGTTIYDILISRFPIETSDNDLYSSKYPSEYPQYTVVGLTEDISGDTITYMACQPEYGVSEFTIDKSKVDIYPLDISYLDKRNIINYFNKTKGNKCSLLACIGHPEMKEEGSSTLEWVLDALGIITPKSRYTIPRLLDLINLLL